MTKDSAPQAKSEAAKKATAAAAAGKKKEATSATNESSVSIVADSMVMKKAKHSSESDSTTAATKLQLQEDAEKSITLNKAAAKPAKHAEVSKDEQEEEWPVLMDYKSGKPVSESKMNPHDLFLTQELRRIRIATPSIKFQVAFEQAEATWKTEGVKQVKANPDKFMPPGKDHPEAGMILSGTTARCECGGIYIHHIYSIV
jgi:hypothetical protein